MLGTIFSEATGVTCEDHRPVPPTVTDTDTVADELMRQLVTDQGPDLSELRAAWESYQGYRPLIYGVIDAVDRLLADQGNS